MIIVYTPAGGQPEHYDAISLKVSEAAIVQRTIDMKWQEILAGLENDDLEAMRAIVWVIKKRSQPSLRFGEFDPGVTEMTARLSTTEIEAYIANAFAAPDRDPEITLEMVADILRGRLPQLAADPDHALAMLEARARDPKEPEPANAAAAEEGQPDGPLSPSPTSSEPEPSTSGSSPTSSTSTLSSSTSSPSATSTP